MPPKPSGCAPHWITSAADSTPGSCRDRMGCWSPSAPRTCSAITYFAGRPLPKIAFQVVAEYRSRCPGRVSCRVPGADLRAQCVETPWPVPARASRHGADGHDQRDTRQVAGHLRCTACVHAELRLFIRIDWAANETPAHVRCQSTRWCSGTGVAARSGTRKRARMPAWSNRRFTGTCGAWAGAIVSAGASVPCG